MIAAAVVLLSAAHAGVAGADDTPAQVRVTTSDGKGAISIDGKVVGEGSFTGTLSAGGHQLRVERAGFVTFEKQIALRNGEVYGESVALVREPAKESAVPLVEDSGAGIYGGMQAGAVFQEGTTGGAFGGDCALFGASSCSSPLPVGFGIGAYFGYSWNPVGLEIYGTGGADFHSPSASFDGVVQPGSNPVLTGPPRDEYWRILRAGGGGAIRARVIWDPLPALRFTFAIGPGFAVRHVIAERRAVARDGGAEDTYGPPGATYASPALSVDLAVHLRVSRSSGFDLGLWSWVETAGDGVIATGDPSRVLVLPSGPVPLRTPDYVLFKGTQAFVGPYLGVQFGP
jgi:hypothetical protein